ncbi:MAG: response regulator [Rhodocyclaceae bacterium]|nr:response regulator [Rhodocyclaceae bacterium]
MSAATPPEFPILVVDDEPNIVNALRRELATPPVGRYRYAVEGFTDPSAALARARERGFAVVISDYRMPQMSGLEFLKALAALQPDCVRIVLSGQTDMDALIKMVNETHIYRFIPKPWTSYFLKSSLAQAIDFRQAALRNRRLADRLRAQGISLPEEAGQVDQILVVDDDLNACHAVARDLMHKSRLDDVLAAMRADVAHARALPFGNLQISVQISTSPLHALKMADSVEFSCVIADYKMPEMDGARLLEAFAEKQPDCARILLSGAASMDEVIAAVDLAHIYSYIPKPWNDYELRAIVAQALAARKLEIENKVLASMCRARGLDAAEE